MSTATEQWLILDHMMDHPQGGFTALLNGPHVLNIGFPGGGSLTFAIANFPPSTWTELADSQGQPLPIAVMVTGQGVRIAWAPMHAPADAGHPHAPTTGDLLAQIERDREAAAALSTGSTAIYAAGVDSAKIYGGWKRR